MINELKMSSNKINNERSNEIALAVDVADNLVTVVYYDLQLKRRYGRASACGVAINPENAQSILVRLITSSMRELKINGSVVASVGIAASVMVAAALEEELSPSDLFLNSDIHIYYVPFISAAVSGRFTASLLTVTADNCIVADFGKTFCAARKQNETIECVSFLLVGAFDGSGYESGMPSENGAIDNVRCEKDGTLIYEVIGDGDSIGVSPCGAAAAISVMLKRGVIDGDGIMLDRDLFAIGEDFFISQSDVRAFQSDKASVFSALSLFKEYEQAFYSGEIFSSGEGLRLISELGVLPTAVQSAFCRNSTEQGIIMCLEDEEMRNRAEKIARNTQDVTASVYSEFDEKYFDALNF